MGQSVDSRQFIHSSQLIVSQQREQSVLNNNKEMMKLEKKQSNSSSHPKILIYWRYFSERYYWFWIFLAPLLFQNRTAAFFQLPLDYSYPIMKPLYSQLATLLLLSSLTLAVHSANWYSYTLNVTIQPQLYQLGYLEKDSTVVISLKTTAAGDGAVDMSTLDVIMLDTTKLEANQMVCDVNGGTNMSATFMCVTVKSEQYFLKISKASYPIEISLNANMGFDYTANYLQYFQITVTTYYNLTNIPFEKNKTKVRTLLKATDVVKDRLARLVYFNQPMTIRLASYPIQNINYLLYHQATNGTQPTGSIYSFSGSPLIDPTDANGIQQSGQYFMTYYITKPGYHLLSSSFPYSAENYPLAYFIISFPSDPYPCPYNSQFPDIKKNFQPCVGTINNNGNISPNTNVPGYPCTFYDSYSNKCLTCANGFTVSDVGTCLYNTTCPPRQYYKFGNCLTASPECDSFDLFTGQCRNCSNPLNYVVNGACIANPALIVNCTDRQYKQNNKCVDVSPRCKQFNRVSGACTTCVNGYELSLLDGSCKWKVVVCIGNQYLKDGVCYNFPANCINFDVITLQCTNCEFSYYISNGVCTKIICPIGKVPSRFGFGCIDVSPTCNQDGFYDKISGECLRCRHGQKVMDGRCVQVVRPLAGCAGQTFFGDCPSVNINCKIYNLLNGECEQCSQKWYKDYNGVCNLRNDNTRCRGDQISIQGFCMQRPANCRVVDSFGLCIQCQREYQLSYGQCVYKLTCRSGQYLNSNGACVNVAAGCAAGRFNPSTGACLTCNDGSAAVGGVCCAAGQVVWGGECMGLQSYSSMLVSVRQLDLPVCVSYHPTLGICMECNGKYRVDRTTNDCI